MAAILSVTLAPVDLSSTWAQRHMARVQNAKAAPLFQTISAHDAQDGALALSIPGTLLIFSSWSIVLLYHFQIPLGRRGAPIMATVLSSVAALQLFQLVLFRNSEPGPRDARFRLTARRP